MIRDESAVGRAIVGLGNRVMGCLGCLAKRIQQPALSAFRSQDGSDQDELFSASFLSPLISRSR